MRPRTSFTHPNTGALLAGCAVLLASCVHPPEPAVFAPELKARTAPVPAAAREAESAEPAPAPAEEVPAAVIARAQSLLAALDYEPGPIDGVEGPLTAAAVRAWQKDAGVEVDGRVSEALVRSLEAKRQGRLIRAVQERLTRLGYDLGPIDGLYGARTRAAVVAFQEQTGMEADGRITSVFIDRLAEAETAPVAESPQPTLAVAPLKATGPTSQTVFAPGDTVRLSISGEEAFTSQLTIDEDGWLSVPGAGRFHAAGMAPAELESEIAVAILDDYLRRLIVDIGFADPEEND